MRRESIKSLKGVQRESGEGPKSLEWVHRESSERVERE